MDIERVVLLAGVMLVVIISMWRRRAGGILGLLLTGGILWWGLSIYQKGGAIGFAGKPLSKTVFLVFCGVFFLYNCFSIWKGSDEKQE
ncbi:MAG: hypothetical protein HY897_02310 [Deltaproteobacteria bacterium]|nr:hypothetical protein [Deltaproteobacteria bacterium]